jgi:predicted RNA-binding protein with RPS1 domain
MSSEYVTAPSDIIEVGSEVEVRVLGVNRKKSQIDLTMKPLVPVDMAIVVDDEEEEEDTPTAMALAYQRAMGNTAPVATSTSKAPKHKKDLARQDEILNRTLQRLENS